MEGMARPGVPSNTGDSGSILDDCGCLGIVNRVIGAREL
jgi:hypothetical protein